MMETRKLIQSGKSALVTTLPKKWLEHHKLSKGDTILIDILSNKLVISPFENKKEMPKFTINLNNKNKEFLELLIYSGFLSDKKEILISNIEKDEFKKIFVILKRIPYLKLEEQEKNSLRLIFLVDPNIINIEKELNKVAILFGTFFNEIIMRKGKDTELEDYYNQIFLEILLLMKILKIKFIEYDKNSLLRFKQQIDSYYFLLKVCKEFLLFSQKTPLTKESCQIIKKIVDSFKFMMEFINQKDIISVLHIQKSVQEERKKLINNVINKLKNQNLQTFFLINDLYKVIENIAYSYINNQ